jgi:hypothetical protein
MPSRPPLSFRDLNRTKQIQLKKYLSAKSVISKGGISIGDLYVPPSTSISNPTPIPSSTITQTPTPTVTLSGNPATPTPTQTPTITHTPTVTPTVTLTVTQTPTITPTLTQTPDVTPASTPPPSNIFNVTHYSGKYIINGVENPSLNLTRGIEYIFNLNALNHPFWIKTTQTIGTSDQYNTGVTNNGTQTGQIRFNVPCDAPSILYYNCQYHSSMRGVLDISGTCSTPTPTITPTITQTSTPTPTPSYDNEFIYTESPEYDQVVSILNNSNSEVIS